MTATDTALANAYHRALSLQKAGRVDEAAILYRKCLELDAQDRCGAALRLASMGRGDVPQKAPDAYVATLFDQHADDFDAILTGALGYAVPMQIADWLTKNRPGPYQRLLDLGCGTGLCGMMLMDLCTHATGVDISDKMVEQSDERAAYDALFINEGVHFLREWARLRDADHQPFDLIVAADMLPYLGALDALFDAIAANAMPDGRLVFSSETLPEQAFGPAGWTITPHQRFAHCAAYLKHQCARVGFDNLELFEPITVRMEQRKPVPGYLVVAARGRSQAMGL